jgi:hypothetical protein
MQPHQPPQLRRHDAAKGRLLADVPLAMLGTSNYVHADSSIFRSDGVALLNGELLVDLDRQLLLWRYVLADRLRRAEHSPDGRVWYFGDAGGRSPIELIGVDPVSGEVRAAAGDLSPGDQYVLKKGDRIRLAIDLGSAGLERSAPGVEAAITKRLNSAGLVVDPSASVTLSVTTSEQQVTQTFRRSSGEVVSFPDVRVAARFSISDSTGRVVWGYEFTNPPVIDLSKPLDGQITGDLTAKKRAGVGAMLIHPDMIGSIPTTLTKDPREILPGESLLGPSGVEPLPAEKRLPPRPMGLERAGP